MSTASVRRSTQLNPKLSRRLDILPVSLRCIFLNPIDALAVCETTAITIPSIEQATNLGFGIWLITSANADFTFRESSSLATSTSRSFAGCHICIITLAFDMQIHTGHFIIRSDIASSSTIPAIKLRLFLLDPLESLIKQVPPLDDLPLYTSKAEAGVTLLKAVRKKLISSPRVRQVNQLVEIARPFAQDMSLLKPSLTRGSNQYVPFKVSFTLTITVFIVSTVLHLVLFSCMFITLSILKIVSFRKRQPRRMQSNP